MKSWQINFILTIGFLAVAVFLPTQIAKPVLLIVIFGSTIWVYRDSKRLGIEKYKKTFLTLSATPGGTAGLVCILWLPAFPMYISWRQRILEGKVPLKDAQVVQ